MKYFKLFLLVTILSVSCLPVSHQDLEVIDGYEEMEGDGPTLGKALDES